MAHAKLGRFFLITFAFSWLLWLPAVLKSNSYPNLPDIVGLPGMFAPFGPAVAAFWLTWQENGLVGTKTLWRRGWRLDFDKQWLLPAVLIGPLTVLLTAGLLILFGRTISSEFAVPPLMIVPIFLLIYFTNALPEEYGWRGYALDPLQDSFKPLGASLILGLIWGVWHLPLFFIEGTTQAAIPLYEFVLQQMVLAAIYTWLHNNTKGSVLIATLFHASANTAAAAVPFWVTTSGRWLNFALLLTITLFAVWHWNQQHTPH